MCCCSMSRQVGSTCSCSAASWNWCGPSVRGAPRCFCTSHVLGEVEGTCDRAIFIRRGHLSSQAQASDLTLDATLERLYGAEALGRHWEGDASAASAAFDSPSAASSKGGRS